MPPLSHSLMNEFSSHDLWAREAVLEHLVRTGRSGTVRRFLLCGGGLPDDPAGRGWKQYCKFRWDPLCLHVKASCALRQTPNATKECANWVLATFALPPTKEISKSTAHALQDTAKRILSDPALTATAAGYLWTTELAFSEPDGDWVFPHGHAILAVPGDLSKTRAAWNSTLDLIGLDHGPETFKPKRTWRDRVAAAHYIHKRWHNRRIPRERLLEHMAAFEGLALMHRTGIFRRSRKRSPPAS
jgi:hypothetical protein